MSLYLILLFFWFDTIFNLYEGKICMSWIICLMQLILNLKLLGLIILILYWFLFYNYHIFGSLSLIRLWSDVDLT